jgi:hypothetical protein
MSPHHTPHPGWLIVMPAGHVHTWHAHTAGCCDPAAALGWFEPDPARRAALVSRGWRVCAGAATELVAPAAARASA